MGIKGRRKKLREREQRAAGTAHDTAQCGEDDDATTNRRADVIDTAAMGMGSGPYQLPITSTGQLKIKKSELYRLQDQDYLERIQDEHQNRKQSHLVGQKRVRNETEAARARHDGANAILQANELLYSHTARPRIDEVNSDRRHPRHDAEHDGVCETRAGTTCRDHSTNDDTGHGDTDDLEPPRCTPPPPPPAAASTVTGGPFSHPLLGIDRAVVVALAQSEHITHMTRIQERSIPYLLQGYDVLGQARTGSGKTLAFGVPLLHHLARTLRQLSSSSTATGAAAAALPARIPTRTMALLLTPTKELCVQIYDVILRLSQAVQHDVLRTPAHRLPPSRLVCLVTGGTKVRDERRALALLPMFVIGTPGRVRDHVQHCPEWKLSSLQVLVLDEADRMLAEGFERDLDAILARLPRSRQTSLFSATNSKSVHALARLSLSGAPVFISTQADRPRLLSRITVAAPTAAAEAGDDEEDADTASRELPAYVSFTAAPPKQPRRRAQRCDGQGGDREGKDARDRGSSHDRSGSSSCAEDGVNSDCEEKEEEEDAHESDADAAVIPSTLRQYCHILPVEHRLLFLYTFVKRVAREHKAMIFCSTVASTIFHFQMMGSVGFHDDVVMLHGHMKHRQRVQAFQLFRARDTGVLFCTDVAARGLDIPAVDWILQYDPPLDPTEYVHRVGRTARAGGVGHALLLLSPEEAGFVSYVHKFGIRLAAYPHAPARLPRIQEKLEHVLQLDAVVAKSAMAAYRAHVGAYQSHILRETFDVQRLDCEALARAFALTSAPHVTLPTNSAEDKRREYVKGKLRSLNRRRMDALKHYEAVKTKQQWKDGVFVGMARPM